MRVLVLHDAGYVHIPTVLHYIDALRQHSRHEIRYCDIGRPLWSLDLRGYGAVFVNYCVASQVRQPSVFFNKSAFERALMRFDGVKVLSVQDEYDETNMLAAHIRRCSYSAVLTCVPVEHVHKVYPSLGNVEFCGVLTGYVGSALLEVARHSPPIAERPIPLGYRGRELAWRLGDVAWHKAEIGRRFAAACAKRGIAYDIEVHERARLYGDHWFGFLKSCRAVLATPSGSNVFDFDGSLHARMVELYEAGASYRDVRSEVEARACGFDMAQVSPRVFEAVACGAALVLLRGNYSGVVDLGKHCIVVELDYSNIDDVLDQLGDVDRLQELADRAFDHVFGNRRNRYEHFVGIVDDLIERHARKPSVEVAAVEHERQPMRAMMTPSPW